MCMTQEAQERIVAKVMQVVQNFLEAAKTWGKKDALYIAEHAALKAAREIAKVLLEEFVASLGAGHCGQHHTDGQGVVRRFKQYVVKTVITLVGPVAIRAAQYLCKGARPATVCPLHEELGLPGGEYSRGMEEVIALAGATEVYREGSKLLSRLTGQDISLTKAESTTESWGNEVKRRRADALESPQTPSERIAAAKKVNGLRRCVAVDGTSVQTTDGWREAKLIACYSFDQAGRKVGQAAYAGVLDYASDFDTALWELMERTQASRAEELVWLGDGAAWIWNQQQIAAPDAVPIVDFYHAAGHVRTVSRAVQATDRKAANWASKWIRNLHNGKIHALVRELARHQRRLGDPPENCNQEDPRKIVAGAHRYFTNNAGRMRYDQYRAKGYPIGSGVVESSCRHIVGLRMKRTATMAWREDRADAMIQLRCLCAGHEWDQFWGFDKLWQHINRLAA